jgi:arylformamidase
MDFISPDQVESTTSPIHHILMGNQIPIIENLNNLDQIDVERIFFSAAPVLVDKADGGVHASICSHKRIRISLV